MGEFREISRREEPSRISAVGQVFNTIVGVALFAGGSALYEHMDEMGSFTPIALIWSPLGVAAGIALVLSGITGKSLVRKDLIIDYSSK